MLKRDEIAVPHSCRNKAQDDREGVLALRRRRRLLAIAADVADALGEGRP